MMVRGMVQKTMAALRKIEDGGNILKEISLMVWLT